MYFLTVQPDHSLWREWNVFGNSSLKKLMIIDCFYHILIKKTSRQKYTPGSDEPLRCETSNISTFTVEVVSPIFATIELLLSSVNSENLRRKNVTNKHQLISGLFRSFLFSSVDYPKNPSRRRDHSCMPWDTFVTYCLRCAGDLPGTEDFGDFV